MLESRDCATERAGVNVLDLKVMVQERLYKNENRRHNAQVASRCIMHKFHRRNQNINNKRLNNTRYQNAQLI